MILWLSVALAYAIEITPWYLPNEEERKELTVAYLEQHYTGVLSGDVEVDTVMEPKVIVLHWTAGSSAKSTWNTFASARLSGRKNIQRGGAVNVGSQFLVDRDGTIYQLLDEKRIARHCIGLNHISIGVENVGGKKGYPLTQEQLEANEQLIRYLSSKYEITHVIGHYEYRLFEGHSYFSEKDDSYRTIKSDPGEEFMANIRVRIQDMGIEGAPK
jgi:hypothetical protein